MSWEEMDEIYGHNLTTYESEAEMKYYENHLDEYEREVAENERSCAGDH